MDEVDIAIIVSVGIALVTFFRGTHEYSRQGAARRAEHFFKMRRLLKQNDTFKDFADLIDKDDQILCAMDFKDKRDYIGLFEEIAIAMNSKLIRKEVAHYMFGYYAIQCWKSDKFWSWKRVERGSIYWAIFRDFVEQMEEMEERLHDQMQSGLGLKRKKYAF